MEINRCRPSRLGTGRIRRKAGQRRQNRTEKGRFMSETAMGNELRAAVHELQRYLGDELAPMMVSDSMLLLMEQSPALLAPQIHAWVGSQYSRGGSNYTASDYPYHAVKKLHVLCELDLIGAERLRDYLKQL